MSETRTATLTPKDVEVLIRLIDVHFNARSWTQPPAPLTAKEVEMLGWLRGRMWRAVNAGYAA
jgi:hypothetical protein